MIAVFLFVFMIASISTIHVDEAENVQHDCPFHRRNGEPCLRSAEFIKYLKENNNERNLRSDIDFRMADDSQIDSANLCCYEKFCLESCGIHSEVIANPYSDGVPDNIKSLIHKYPQFFQYVNYKELDQLLENDRDKYLRVEWAIKVAHLWGIEKEREEVEKTFEKLNEMF